MIQILSPNSMVLGLGHASATLICQSLLSCEVMEFWGIEHAQSEYFQFNEISQVSCVFKLKHTH